MHPTDTLKLFKEISRFKADHPKAVAFLSSLAKEGIQEGTVLELKTTSPSGEEKICNLRVNAQDMELIALAKELGRNTPTS